MKSYQKVCNVIFNILKWVVAIAMVFMVLLTFVEVIRRYFFHQNWVWSEELVRYLIVWCTFLGGAAAYRVGALTNFDLVIQKFSKRMRVILDLVCTVIIIALMAWLTCKGYQSFTRPSIVNQVSAALDLSMRWPYLGIPVGCAAIVLFAIEHLLKLIQDLSSGAAKKEVEQA